MLLFWRQQSGGGEQVNIHCLGTSCKIPNIYVVMLQILYVHISIYPHFVGLRKY